MIFFFLLRWQHANMLANDPVVRGWFPPPPPSAARRLFVTQSERMQSLTSELIWLCGASSQRRVGSAQAGSGAGLLDIHQVPADLLLIKNRPRAPRTHTGGRFKRRSAAECEERINAAVSFARRAALAAE